MFAPTLHAGAAKYGKQILQVILDTEVNPAIGQHYNIRSIPTLAIFQYGGEIDRIAGVISPA